MDDERFRSLCLLRLSVSRAKSRRARAKKKLRGVLGRCLPAFQRPAPLPSLASLASLALARFSPCNRHAIENTANQNTGKPLYISTVFNPTFPSCAAVIFSTKFSQRCILVSVVFSRYTHEPLWSPRSLALGLFQTVSYFSLEFKKAEAPQYCIDHVSRKVK